MDETIKHLDELAGTESRVVMATLVDTRGTTPKRAGAKMWVGQGGRVLGSVTIGGCVDARVMEESAEVLEEGAARRVSMALSDEEAWDLGMTCGGTVNVLMEPVELEAGDPVVDAYESVARELSQGRDAVVVTSLDSPGARLVVLGDGTLEGSLGDPGLDEAAAQVAARVRKMGRSAVKRLEPSAPAEPAESPEAGESSEQPSKQPREDEGDEYFFELHLAPVTLLLFGAGNVAIPLVRMAAEVGWRVVVVDNREGFANEERFPDAHEIRLGMVSEIAGELEYGPNTAVVVVAHDYKYEVPVLRRVLEEDAFYVGVLGSRRRGKALMDFLAQGGSDGGVDQQALARIHMPVGLNIGSRTAPEIAVSIVAEILAVRTGRPGTPMRDRK